MDSDTMRRPGSHAKVLAAFRRGEVRILFGTQMIAKGLDFPNVTLVGVVNADVGMHLPDFRAAERTFQLLAQVSGRAGRGSQGGRVLVQTFNPEQPCVALAAAHEAERQAEELRRKTAELEREAAEATALREARLRLVPGDSVRVPKFDKVGKVVRTDFRKNVVMVSLGLGQWEVGLDEVFPVEK